MWINLFVLCPIALFLQIGVPIKKDFDLFWAGDLKNSRKYNLGTIAVIGPYLESWAFRFKLT